MSRELSVHITEGRLGDGIKVFVVRRHAHDDQRILRNTGETGFTSWEHLEPNVDVAPTFTLDGETGRALADALVRHYQGAEDMRSLRRDYDAALQRSDAQASVIADVVRSLAANAGANR